MRKDNLTPDPHTYIASRAPAQNWCARNPPTDQQPFPPAAMLWFTDANANLVPYFGTWQRIEGEWHSNTYPRRLKDTDVHAYAWLYDITNAASIIIGKP